MPDLPVHHEPVVVTTQGAAVPPPPPETGSSSRAEAAPTFPLPPDRLLFTPRIDIYDSDEGLVLIADLPGVTVNSLELQVQDNKLTLFGRVAPVAPQGAKLIHREYEEGDFLRSFILSDDVDHERISAKLNHGVLEVVLPRTPKPPPRRIQVNMD